MTDAVVTSRDLGPAVMGYDGSPTDPYPPHALGWAPATADDAAAFRGAEAIKARGLLGQPYSFVDELVAGEGAGIFRFFSFETPVGVKVGALRYVGGQATAGQVADMPVPPPADQPPNPEAPPAGQGPGTWYGATFISDTLDQAAAALFTRLTSQGCTTQPFAECFAFQQAYNAQDSASAVNGPGQLTYDGKYGDETARGLQGVLDAETPGQYNAPAGCFAAGGGGGGAGGEPTPGADASCSAWTPDTSTQATAIAHSIVFDGSPVAFKDQGHYDTTIGGVLWRIVMWKDSSGVMNAATFRCTKQTAAPGSGGSGLGIGLATVAVAALAGAVIAFKAGVF